jgi:hypothetical protein
MTGFLAHTFERPSRASAENSRPRINGPRRRPAGASESASQLTAAERFIMVPEYILAAEWLHGLG